MDEWIILQPTVLLNRTFSNLPQQTCFVHFSVSCWWHHISQFRDEHIELISSLFLTQISRPPFSVFFFREVIHFDVKIFTLLSRETKFVFPFSRTRVEQWKRNYFSIRFCFNPPPMPYTLAYYVIIKSWERRREEKFFSNWNNNYNKVSSVEVIWRVAYEGLAFTSVPQISREKNIATFLNVYANNSLFQTDVVPR